MTKNWGVWGADDERGALNRITPAAVMRAVATVRSGEPLSLAVPLVPGKGPIFHGRAPLQHFMTRHGGDYAAGLPEKGFGYADDYVLLATHGTTHLDALSHVWQGGLMWNGFSANEVTSRGAMRCDIRQTGPITTRAIIANLDRGDCDTEYRIHADELRDAVESTGVVPEQGDALLVRTGWLRRWRSGAATESLWSGLDAGCAEWIDEQGFALVGADNMAVEYGPSPDPQDAAPLHVELIRNRGIYLLELMDLEQLHDSGRHECMLVVSPMPLVGGVGSPVNPVAIL
jgi:kynurenine formamidase